MKQWCTYNICIKWEDCPEALTDSTHNMLCARYGSRKPPIPIKQTTPECFVPKNGLRIYKSENTKS